MVAYAGECLYLLAGWLQASGEKLVTRDAVLGMSVHDEGALVAQSARDELESAFVSLARLASSKVDL